MAKTNKLLLQVMYISILAGTEWANMSTLPMITKVVEYAFGVSDIELGLAQTLHMLFMAFCFVAMGYLADKVARKRLAFFASVAWAIFTLLVAFSVNFWMFLVFYVLSAIGYGAMFPIGMSIIADISPPEKRGIYSVLFVAIGGIGTSLGPIFGVTLVPVYGWQFVFAILGIVGFIVCGAIPFMKEPMRGASEKELAALREYKYTIHKEDLKAILSKKTNILIVLQGFFGCIPWGAITMWLPAMFATMALAQNISKDAATLAGNVLYWGYWLGGLAGSLSFSWLGDRKHQQGQPHWRTKLAILGIGLSTPLGIGTFFAVLSFNFNFPETTNTLEMIFSLISQVFANPINLLILIYLIISVFVISGGGTQTSPVMLDVNLPEHRGTMSSLMNVGNILGQAVSPLLASITRVMILSGGVTELMSYVYTLALFSLMWILCALMWVKIHYTYPQDSALMHKTLEERAKNNPPTQS
ncbi:MAG: MFS transporter [Candidatus Korarchaeota archaeon]